MAIAAGALTPVLAYSGNLGFAPAVGLGGIACAGLALRPRRPSRGMWLLIALLAWALASYAWSPAAPDLAKLHRYKQLEAITGLKLVLELALYAGFALAMQRVSARGATKALWALTALITVMAVVLVLEGFGQAPFYMLIKSLLGQPTTPDLAMRNVARGCYVIALLFWPLAMFIEDRGLRGLSVVIGLGGLLAAFLLHVDAPIAALLAGSAAFALVRTTGRRGLWLCIAGVAAYFVLAPVAAGLIARAPVGDGAAGHIGKLSWGYRLQIWSFVEERILAHPITGWGLDASRAWPGRIPLHPHDAALQLWLELGPLGAALAALFFAWLFTRIAALERTDRPMAAAAAACATAYLVVGALSFGVWQEWWLALGALSIAVCGWVAASRQGLRAERAEAALPLAD